MGGVDLRRSQVNHRMRYLVRARLKPGCERALQEAIESKQLGAGSVAEGEYLRNMAEARRFSDGTARWVGFGVIANNLMSTATFLNARAAG